MIDFFFMKRNIYYHEEKYLFTRRKIFLLVNINVYVL